MPPRLPPYLPLSLPPYSSSRGLFFPIELFGYDDCLVEDIEEAIRQFVERPAELASKTERDQDKKIRRWLRLAPAELTLEILQRLGRGESAQPVAEFAIQELDPIGDLPAFSYDRTRRCIQAIKDRLRARANLAWHFVFRACLFEVACDPERGLPSSDPLRAVSAEVKLREQTEKRKREMRELKLGDWYLYEVRRIPHGPKSYECCPSYADSLLMRWAARSVSDDFEHNNPGCRGLTRQAVRAVGQLMEARATKAAESTVRQCLRCRKRIERGDIHQCEQPK
jgi:hypothetical protein